MDAYIEDLRSKFEMCAEGIVRLSKNVKAKLLINSGEEYYG